MDYTNKNVPESKKVGEGMAMPGRGLRSVKLTHYRGFDLGARIDFAAQQEHRPPGFKKRFGAHGDLVMVVVCFNVFWSDVILRNLAARTKDAVSGAMP